MENASVTFNVHLTGRNVCFSFIHLILTTHSERWLFPSNINPSRRPVTFILTAFCRHSLRFFRSERWRMIKVQLTC